MKEGLIRLTDEENIFYDSVEKVYRYRMHCPECGIEVLPCRCYQDIYLLLCEIDEGFADLCCSAKCALLIGEWDELEEAMQEADLVSDLNYPEIKDLTEEQAQKVLDILVDHADFDYPSGEECST